MIPLFLRQSIASAFAGALLALTPLQAQQADASLLHFRDGISLRVPTGWQTVTVALDAPARSPQEVAASNPALPLLRIQAPETHPAASLTLVRDENLAQPASDREAAERLGEMAACEGGRVEKMLQKSGTDGTHAAIFCEAEATFPGGPRILGCLALERPGQSTLRCYWQRRADDREAKTELEGCLASLKLGETDLPRLLAATAPPTAPAPANQPEMSNGDLVNRWRGCLALVEGQKGKGSGFLCQIDGVPWLITNIHVLADNLNPRFTTLDRQRLVPKEAFLAVDHDICKLKTGDTGGTPMVMLDVESEVQVGDEVVVPGNAEGAGVITPISGKVVGIGPNLVEVDAPFVPGNSGSPIFHRKSGKIIGVATYLTIQKPGGRAGVAMQATVRRFGYRLDSVRTWEPVNWQRFYVQSAQLTQIEATSAEFIKLFESSSAGPLTSGNYKTPAIRQAIENYRGRLEANSHPSPSDREMVRRSLFSDLRAATRSDIIAFDSRNAYDYFRRKVTEEQRLRDELYTQLSQEIESRP